MRPLTSPTISPSMASSIQIMMGINERVLVKLCHIQDLLNVLAND